MHTDDLHRPLYVPDIIANALNQTPERPWLQIAGGPMLTVGEVRDATSQYIQALQSLGVGPDSRVATLSSNRPEVLHVANAIQLIGAIAVPMHPLGGVTDHVYVLTDARVDVLIFDGSRFSQRAAELKERLPNLKLIAFGVSEVAEDLTKLTERFKPERLRAPKLDGAKVARITYSGGTTGKPKAIEIPQRVSMACLQIMMSEWEWPSPPRVLSVSPLSHAGSAMVLPALLREGTIMIQPSFDPVKTMEAIQEYRINSMLVVPTMIYALLDHPRFSEFDLSSLQTVFYGASAISPSRLKEAIERIGPVFAQFYGQAEAPMGISYLRKSEHDVSDMRRLASCGRTSPWARVELLDADGKAVPDGEPGEVCVQGPLVMDGYRDNADLT
ncbi:MAG TPA: AMP-binding protein, partial [Polyangiales bacterium]|nr:AMP-binding protein [Polyangiales bacterium]